MRTEEPDFDLTERPIQPLNGGTDHDGEVPCCVHTWPLGDFCVKCHEQTPGSRALPDGSTVKVPERASLNDIRDAGDELPDPEPVNDPVNQAQPVSAFALAAQARAVKPHQVASRDVRQLFAVGKVPMHCAGINFATEDRHGDTVKVCILTLEVDPFDAKLATVMEGGVRSALFNLNDEHRKPILRRVDLALGLPPQQMQCFASSDTAKASIAFDQVAVKKITARVDKDKQGYTLVVKASFGPLGRPELEYVQKWLLEQRSVSWDAAEPMLDDVTD